MFKDSQHDDLVLWRACNIFFLYLDTVDACIQGIHFLCVCSLPLWGTFNQSIERHKYKYGIEQRRRRRQRQWCWRWQESEAVNCGLILHFAHLSIRMYSRACSPYRTWFSRRVLITYWQMLLICNRFYLTTYELQSIPFHF